MNKPTLTPSEIISEPVSEPILPSASLARKMLEVMKEVKYVQKNGKNNFHNYTYATESAIVKAFREALIKHSIMMYTSIVDRTTHTFKTKKGDDSFLITVKIIITFVDADTGHSIASMFYGDGADSGDKGLYKAITGAHKYALMKTFMLETGDDPEHDEPIKKAAPPKPKAAPVNPASKEQKAKIMQLMTKTQTDAGGMREIMNANPQLKAKNFNTIMPEDANLIIELLTKKESLKGVKDE